MKTSDSNSEQKTPASFDASKDIPNENNTSRKENPSDEELRLVDEKNMVGQPMGNHIQNSNFKHQTPIDETNKQNFSEGDSNLMKEKLQVETSSIEVIRSLKKSNGKPQKN
jgi:hypothetical protein